MTSNNDILAFLKSEKEAREKEKEEEKAARSKERQEDMAKMANLIRDGVREEVKAAVKEVDERLVAQEKISQDLGKQIQSIMSELTTLKKGKETSRSGLPVQAGEEGVGAVGHGEGAVVSDTSTGDGLSDRGKILEICSKARKIVGFSPIEPRMLDIQMRAYGAQNVEEAMIMEVKSYLKCEMKVPQSEIERHCKNFSSSQRILGHPLCGVWAGISGGQDLQLHKGHGEAGSQGSEVVPKGAL